MYQRLKKNLFIVLINIFILLIIFLLFEIYFIFNQSYLKKNLYFIPDSNLKRNIINKICSVKYIESDLECSLYLYNIKKLINFLGLQQKNTIVKMNIAILGKKKKY